MFESSGYGAPPGGGDQALSDSEVVITSEAGQFRYFHAARPWLNPTAQDVVAIITGRASVSNPAPWVLAAGLCVAVCLIGYPILAVGAVAAAGTAAAILNRDCQRRRTTYLSYRLSEAQQRAYAALQAGLASLSAAQAIWRVDPDSVAYSRTAAHSGLQAAPFVRSNLGIFEISAGTDTFYFLPDQLLIRTRSTFTGVEYAGLNVQTTAVDLIETTWVPSDATTLGRRWKYARRDGGPDRRYRDNPSRPVVRYALVTLTMNQYRLGLLVSNASQAEAFVSAIRCISASAMTEASRATAAASAPAPPAINPPQLEPPRDPIRPPLRTPSLPDPPQPERLRGPDPQNQASPRTQRVPEQAQWIPCSQCVTVAGFEIPGMIYFGRNLRALKGGVAEPALIDPARSVALSSDGFEPQSIPDWPSYADISPAARHAYLMWHSHGRVEPDAPISFVFLHFYGLERRLLSDLGASGSGDLEHQQLLQEVRRLLDIYGKNNSFRGYASAFLEFTEAVRLGRQNDVPFPEFSFTGYDIPARLKFALGAMSRAGQPIPAPWARAWAIADPSFSRRTPFQRCAPYFSLLFEARYRECFGDGVVVKPNRTLIRIEYHPASASFGGSLVFKSELPDITVLKEPIAKLRALAEECTNELDPYSRYLGRKPNGEKDLAALALLPPLLLSTAQVGHTRNLRDKIAQQVGTGLLLTRKELFSLAESSETATFGKRDAVTLAQTLAAMGFGIEPDVRFGGPVLSTSMRAYLFPLTAEAAAVSAPTQAYSAATVLIHLAALLSLADGTVTQEQEEQIEAHIGSALNLSEDERLRLDAHRHWVLTERPVLAGVKKRVESLALPQRQAIGRFLAGVASAGGDISPNEVNMLRQMYRMLDLNQQDVYSDAHQAATSPVTVLPAKEISAGFAIPQRRRAAEGRRLQLDASVVEATLKETAKVSALLASVFADETPPAPVAQPTEGADCVPGLDAEGSALVRVLVKKAAWSRGELEAIAAEGAMLLDGAIEAVNDLAIDCFDALALEGDDPIEVNISVLTSLIQRIAT